MNKIATKDFTANMVLEGSWGTRQLGMHASTMDLYVQDDKLYGFIEWDIPAIDDTEQIGLWFEFNAETEKYELTDYDGVHSLPWEAATLLEEQGFVVPEDMR